MLLQRDGAAGTLPSPPRLARESSPPEAEQDNWYLCGEACGWGRCRLISTTLAPLTASTANVVEEASR